jgi:hypothetical protein
MAPHAGSRTSDFNRSSADFPLVAASLSIGRASSAALNDVSPDRIHPDRVPSGAIRRRQRFGEAGASQ